MAKLDGRICLITGGARGLGEAMANLFSEEGATVWICDVLDDEGSSLAKSIGAQYLHLDVRDEAAWTTVVEEIVANDGGLDVLINNAGVFRANRLKRTTLDEFNEVMAINATSVFLGMRATAPAMIESGSGSIVNISSTAGLSGAPGAFAYGASKWTVRGMTKSAAVDLASKGVRVNSIHPGLIETPMAELLGPRERITARIPLSRGADPMEVARLALFLASDESSFSTGSEFIVDGGTSATG